MSTTTNDATPITRPPRPPKPPKPHPSIAALSAFLSNLPQTATQPPPLPSKLRYDIYGPLLLLPPTSPLTSPPWSTYISSLPPQSQFSLYATLAKSLNVTHIAINSPIPSKSVDHQNAIRAPQITPLYGSFGPLDSTDFEEVFWTSTVQHGVFQTWCPLHTMFSRGNITEKNRIYGLVDTQLKELRRSGEKRKVAAVDLFVGIGRGAVGNKWAVTVNREGSDCENVGTGEERLVIFEESNEYAIDRLRRIKQQTTEAGKEWVHILHVNLGLLPTSSGAYKTALEVLGLNNGGGEAWIHVHENVAKEDVDEMKDGIIKKFEQLKGEVEGMEEVRIEVEHVEFVKSWAPGVWHCVFDVKVS
ncbi:hypothetical protein TWF173_003026 [Orbilia oligospora]|nr:hypothetical protein TWF173_003026 [Orbilia oligospora]